MEIANARGIKVIEDVSHAHGAMYKGRLTGGIGHVGAMSCMAGKSLAIGEAGMLVTDDQEIYERAIAFGHYERTGQIENPELKKFAGLPLGGFKYRMHQLSSAVGRVQLRHYRERMEEIDRSMNSFWDLLEGAPGLRPHRPPKGSRQHDGRLVRRAWHLRAGGTRRAALAEVLRGRAGRRDLLRRGGQPADAPASRTERG